MAALWHKTIEGRKKQHIISLCYIFWLAELMLGKLFCGQIFAHIRTQTAFFTFLVHTVNSPDVLADMIKVNYFDPRHTFMSADQFYHQVEKFLKKMKKVYDFSDFKNVVQSANFNKVYILEMQLTDSYLCKNFLSIQKIYRGHSERPYIFMIWLKCKHKGDQCYHSTRKSLMARSCF